MRVSGGSGHGMIRRERGRDAKRSLVGAVVVVQFQGRQGGDVGAAVDNGHRVGRVGR